MTLNSIVVEHIQRWLPQPAIAWQIVLVRYAGPFMYRGRVVLRGQLQYGEFHMQIECTVSRSKRTDSRGLEFCHLLPRICTISLILVSFQSKLDHFRIALENPRNVRNYLCCFGSGGSFSAESKTDQDDSVLFRKRAAHSLVDHREEAGRARRNKKT